MATDSAPSRRPSLGYLRRNLRAHAVVTQPKTVV
jgi:hypothetical protein